MRCNRYHLRELVVVIVGVIVSLGLGPNEVRPIHTCLMMKPRCLHWPSLMSSKEASLRPFLKERRALSEFGFPPEVVPQLVRFECRLLRPRYLTDFGLPYVDNAKK